MSLTDGYDTGNDQVRSDSLNLPIVRAGAYSNVDAALRYTRITHSQRRLTINASDTLRYEPQLQDVLASSYQASVAFATPVRRRGRLDLSQGIGYTPYYQLELFPTLAVDATQLPKAPTHDYAISKQSANTYTTGIGFMQDLNRRASLQFGYELRSVMFDDAARDLLTQAASVKLIRRARRYAGFHVGATTRAGRYGLASPGSATRTQELEFGLDYARRRTSISVSSGSSFIPDGSGKISHRLTGNASARFEMSRTWSANVQYNRSLRFVEALAYPFFSDSISAGLNGQPARRLSLGASFGYSTGQVGVSAEGGTYGTYTGSAEFSVPLTRHYAFYSEYLYYYYSFTEQAFADALPPRLGRRTLRAGLRLWFPLMN